MRALVDEGITAATVVRALRSGGVERLSRGVYRGVRAPLGANVDFASVAARVPRGVLCLFSAASVHGLGDEIAVEVWLAIPFRDHTPKLGWPQVRPVRWRSLDALSVGVETRIINGVEVRLTEPARTVLDMLRMRATVGEDRALETLRDFVARGGSLHQVRSLAERFGVSRTVTVYLNAFAHMALAS